MKHQHHNSRCLPQSLASDHPASLACNHRLASAMKEIGRGQSLVTQLRAIVLPALQVQADERSELVAQMFQNILDCSCKAMAELELLQSRNARPDDVLVDDKKRVQRISSDDCTKVEAANKPHRQHKRRRFDNSMSLETPIPHYDGGQWRKYGQKNINNSKYPRSYYRCTYRQEQGCKARKTVQQQNDSSGADHTLMYTVVYCGQHTCKGNDSVISGPDDFEINIPIRSSSGQSSISSAGINPCDHQTSQNDNKQIDKSEDNIVTNDMYEPFDMTVFAPLDLDSWELDALLKF